MSQFRPCARCEEELPETAFQSPEAPFCKRCAQEMESIARTRYSVIEAAHFRAQLRQKTRRLQKKFKAKA